MPRLPPRTPYTVGATGGSGTDPIVPSDYASSSQVIWKWNGTDVSQFETAPSYLTIVGGGGASPGSPPSISYVDTGGIGPRDQVDANGSGGAGIHYYFFEITDMPVLPDRYIFQYRMGRSANDANNWIGFHRGSYVFGGFGSTPVATGIVTRLGVSPQVTSTYVPYADVPFVGVNANSGVSILTGLSPTRGNTVRERHNYEPFDAGSTPTYMVSHVPVDGDCSTNVPAIVGFSGAFGAGAEFTGLPLTKFWMVVRASGAAMTVEYSELVILKHEWDL